MTIALINIYNIYKFEIKYWYPLTLYTTMHWMDVPCGTPGLCLAVHLVI